MKLKHDDAKRRMDLKSSAAKPRAFALGAVLACGLVLLGPAQASPQGASGSGKQEATQAKLDCRFSSGQRICKANKTPLKAGDPILTEESNGFAMKVTKVDGKGIEVGTEVKISTSGHLLRSKPIRINFGETRTFGEPDVAFSIKAEKGPKPETVIVTIKNSDKNH